MMPQEQRNVWLATAIILLMFIAWQFFYELPRIQREQEALERQQELAATDGRFHPAPGLHVLGRRGRTRCPGALPGRGSGGVAPHCHPDTESERLHRPCWRAHRRSDTPRLSHGGRTGLAGRHPAVAGGRPVLLLHRVRLARRGLRRDPCRIRPRGGRQAMSR